MNPHTGELLALQPGEKVPTGFERLVEGKSLEMLARLKIEREKEKGDPIPPVVAALAAEARLLCFDEMVVNNMADAAIMSRLFAGLFDAGVTVITTSNRHPDDLYKDGLNRQLFLPFIDLVKVRSEHGPLAQIARVNAIYPGPILNLCGLTWYEAINDRAREDGVAIILHGAMGNYTISESGTLALRWA